MMEITAKLSGADVSAQKARLVADQIRGKNVDDALGILSFGNKKSSQIIFKVLNSAIANAENNAGLDIDNLKVTTVFVNEGKSLKRMRPRAKGKGDRFTKRTCHITVKVASTEA